MADDLAAILAGMQARHYRIPDYAGICRSDHQKWPCDASLALAAALAVVELHQPVTTNGGWLEGLEWQECGECGPNNGQEGIYATPGNGEEFWPCPTREAITAVLAGKEASDGT